MNENLEPPTPARPNQTIQQILNDGGNSHNVASNMLYFLRSLMDRAIETDSEITFQTFEIEGFVNILDDVLRNMNDFYVSILELSDNDDAS